MEDTHHALVAACNQPGAIRTPSHLGSGEVLVKPTGVAAEAGLGRDGRVGFERRKRVGKAEAALRAGGMGC